MKNLILILLCSISALGAVTAPPYTSQQVQVFPTLASLATNANPNLKPGGVYQTVDVQGWGTPGDGGGGRFTLTNSVVKTNTATLIYSGLAGYSWKRIDEGPPSAKWWGIKGNLDSGDAAKCDLMLQDLGTNGATVKWPIGMYKINALMPSSMIWDCEGSSMRGASPLGTLSQTAKGVVFFSSDPTKPTIKFGNSWGAATSQVYTRNSVIKNACIVGSSTTTNNFSDCGVYFAGGSFGCYLENCQIGYFKCSVKNMGEAGAPNYKNSLKACTVTMPSFMADSSSNDFRGVYVSAPKSGDGNSFTTKFAMTDGSNIEGGPYGYDVEVDGCSFDLDDTYSDSFDSDFVTSHSVILNHSVTTAFSSDPILHGGYFDGNGIQIVVNFDNGAGALRNTISYYADGTTAAGAIKFWDGNMLPFDSGIGGPGGQYYTYTYPVIFGAMFFRPPGVYGSIFTNALASEVSMNASSSGRLEITTASTLVTRTGAGTGIQNVSTTPRIDLTMSTFPFANSTMVGSITNFTISPPNTNSSVIITGAGVNSTAAGLLTAPNITTPGSLTLGGNIFSMSNDLIVKVTNEFQVFSSNGILTASPTQPALYFIQQITNSGVYTNPLSSIYAIGTNLHLHPAVSDSGSVVIGGIGLNATAAGVVTAPGTIKSGTGFILGAAAGPSGHYLRGNGTMYIDGTIDGGDIATGTIGSARLGSGLANSGTFLAGDNVWRTVGSGSGGDVYLAGTNVFTGTNSFSGITILTNAANVLWGNGTAISAINAANISSGSLADARLSANVPLLNAANVFSGAQSLTNTANVIVGSFTGNGSGLNSLNASELVSGTVPNARLGSGTPSAYTYLAGDHVWRTLLNPGFTIFPGTTFLVRGNMATNLLSGEYLPDKVGDSIEIWFTGVTQSATGTGVDSTLYLTLHTDVPQTATITIPVPATDTTADQYFVQWNLYRDAIGTIKIVASFNSATFRSVYSSQLVAFATTNIAVSVDGLNNNPAYMRVDFAKVNHFH